MDESGSRSKCEWSGNPGEWNDDSYIADDGTETWQSAERGNGEYGYSGE